MKKIIIVISLFVISCNDRGVDEQFPIDPYDTFTKDTTLKDTIITDTAVVDTLRN